MLHSLSRQLTQRMRSIAEGECELFRGLYIGMKWMYNVAHSKYDV